MGMEGWYLYVITIIHHFSLISVAKESCKRKERGLGRGRKEGGKGREWKDRDGRDGKMVAYLYVITIIHQFSLISIAKENNWVWKIGEKEGKGRKGKEGMARKDGVWIEGRIGMEGWYLYVITIIHHSSLISIAVEGVL